MAICLLCQYFANCARKRPTVGVSRKWAGRDSTQQPEKTQRREKTLKTRRIPLVGCTLCWAVLTLKLVMAFLEILRYLSFGHEPEKLLRVCYDHFLHNN